MPFIGRVAYIVLGWFILPFVLLYAVSKNLKHLPKPFYYWDNEEDGFYGDKRRHWDTDGDGVKDDGWYENYLNIEYDSLSFFGKWWHCYRWCALRNPAWNLRYHPWIGKDLRDVTYRYTGNTYEHNYGSGKRTKKWYTLYLDNGGKANYRLIPITKNKSLQIRWGWKVYPYLDFKNLPKYKTHSVYVISFRRKNF